MAVILHKFAETLNQKTANHSPIIHVIHSTDLNLTKRNKNNLIYSTRMRENKFAISNNYVTIFYRPQSDAAGWI